MDIIQSRRSHTHTLVNSCMTRIWQQLQRQSHTHTDVLSVAGLCLWHFHASALAKWYWLASLMPKMRRIFKQLQMTETELFHFICNKTNCYHLIFAFQSSRRFSNVWNIFVLRGGCLFYCTLWYPECDWHVNRKFQRFFQSNCKNIKCNVFTHSNWLLKRKFSIFENFICCFIMGEIHQYQISDSHNDWNSLKINSMKD